MAYELKEGQCTIFKNDKKENEKHPDYNGTVSIGGVEKSIALWVKTSAKGTKYFSGQISDKYSKDSSQSSNKTPASVTQEDDSSLPF